jgi:hypothetical protein
MRGKTNLILTLLAVVAFGGLGLAQQTERKLHREAERVPVAFVAKRATRDSREVQAALADKKFLDACEILFTSGEMFLVDSAQVSTAGAQFVVTFNVVNEVTKEPGQYKQLVYEFDGKDSATAFNQENRSYRKPNLAGNTSKIKWPPPPPPWWPGSGGNTIGGSGPIFGGGTISGGFQWDDWHQVAVDNCHVTFFCPMFHTGKMKQEERASKANPSIKQTRWLLISCGC